MYRISTYLILLTLVLGSVKAQECPPNPGQSPGDYPADPNIPYPPFSFPANEPKPADDSVLETTEVEVTLNWSPGYRFPPYASPIKHHVYLGDSLDDVSKGDCSTFKVTQSGTAFHVDGLIKGKTYYWRIDEVLADGSVITGLAWNFTIPGEKALAPNPADGAVSVNPGAEFSWMAGEGANSHDVYFGDNLNDVDAGKDNTYVGSVKDAKFVPQIQELGKTYYWRVDALYDSTPKKGEIWSFTATNSIVIDDFESYTSDELAGQAIWQSWTGGSDVPPNGSQVGYADPPYAEQTVVRHGDQSMPLFYENTADGDNSEAALTLTAMRDWTEYGVGVLSIWFRGKADNAAEPMYVILSDPAGASPPKFHDDPDAAIVHTWTEWVIDLQYFHNRGIDLTNVNSVTVGLGAKGNRQAPGGSGMVLFDDIRLYSNVSLPRVLYIYDDDVILAKSFQSLLEEHGCPTTLIRINEVSTAALAACDLIVMGDDTEFIADNPIELISKSDKRVVAVGEGGYQFLGKLESEIGWPHGKHGSDNSILVIDPDSSLFSEPRAINVPENQVLTLYTQASHVGVYLKPVPETVTPIGKEVYSNDHYPLALENDRYLLWGFTGSPESMTQIGKDLFANVVIHTANAAWDEVSCPLCEDVNRDGEINMDDLVDFTAQWLANCPDTTDPCLCRDVNGDGVVDSDDLATFTADWLATCL
jgi:hypothetical protein